MKFTHVCEQQFPHCRPVGVQLPSEDASADASFSNGTTRPPHACMTRSVTSRTRRSINRVTVSRYCWLYKMQAAFPDPLVVDRIVHVPLLS